MESAARIDTGYAFGPTRAFTDTIDISCGYQAA
jgi:hypothetical protein